MEDLLLDEPEDAEEHEECLLMSYPSISLIYSVPLQYTTSSRNVTIEYILFESMIASWLALYLCDAAQRRNLYKLINQSLTIHLSQNPSLIIIPESPAHSLIVHVWFVLVKTPQS